MLILHADIGSSMSNNSFRQLVPLMTVLEVCSGRRHDALANAVTNPGLAFLALDASDDDLAHTFGVLHVRASASIRSASFYVDSAEDVALYEVWKSHTFGLAFLLRPKTDCQWPRLLHQRIRGFLDHILRLAIDQALELNRGIFWIVFSLRLDQFR